jgi:DNA-binding NarL/FixJ family response regulator
MTTTVEAIQSSRSVRPETGNRRLRVVVADGSPRYADVILALLEFYELADVIGRAGDFEETIQLVANHQPDIVLIDLEMPLAKLVIPAVVLATRASVRVVGMCGTDTIPPSMLDVITLLGAVLHKSRLRDEFPVAVRGLYGCTGFQIDASLQSDLDHSAKQRMVETH